MVAMLLLLLLLLRVWEWREVDGMAVVWKAGKASEAWQHRLWEVELAPIWVEALVDWLQVY